MAPAKSRLPLPQLPLVREYAQMFWSMESYRRIRVRTLFKRLPTSLSTDLFHLMLQPGRASLARLFSRLRVSALQLSPAIQRDEFLSRNIRVQEDLVDQFFNSSEKRLARALLLLARFGKDGAPETMVPKISPETLTEMMGTTRSRINFFMNRFGKLGFIDYNGKLTVHSSLLAIVLCD